MLAIFGQAPQPARPSSTADHQDEDIFTLSPCFVHWARTQKEVAPDQLNTLWLFNRILGTRLGYHYRAYEDEDEDYPSDPDQNAWAKRWNAIPGNAENVDHDPIQHQLRVASMQELLRCAFNLRYTTMGHFCFCRDSWNEDGPAHCRKCGGDQEGREWHCGKCGKCRYGLNIRCKGCKGVSTSYHSIFEAVERDRASEMGL
jgi:hypothetical protein